MQLWVPVDQWRTQIGEGAVPNENHEYALAVNAVRQVTRLCERLRVHG